MHRVTTYTITLDSGVSFPCPDDRPILYAAIQQGVSLPFRCRTGACGSCRARILSGRVDQSQESRPLPPTANQHQAHLCQAYALSDCRIRMEGQGAVGVA